MLFPISVAARAGGDVRWRPMLLGGVFKAIGTPNVPLMLAGQAKQQHYGKDMLRWAAWWEVPFAWPTRFPMNTIKALRVTLVSPDPAKFIHRAFKAYWVEDQDLANANVLATLLSDIGQDPALVAETENPTVKERLIAETNEAVRLGVFGAPTSVVDGELFWGQDRLGFVERALQGWKPKTA